VTNVDTNVETGMTIKADSSYSHRSVLKI